MSTPAVTPAPEQTLARRMGLFLLIVYGVGDMVGSGIYGTIGEAAGLMGNAVWLAFVASMLAAMFTGLSYASLASRHPRAAGASYVTGRAYRMNVLTYVVGLSVTASGLTSMATNSNVFAGRLNVLLENPVAPGGIEVWHIALAFLAVMTVINLRGIQESMWTNVFCTAVEVGGLLFVIAVGAKFWGGVNYLETPPQADGQPGGLDFLLITSGAVLTFFAFVGFEDMLNVAEEVKNPERNMPWGIVLALGITTLLYLAISVTAVSVVPFQNLADPKQGAPLAQVTTSAAPWVPKWVFEVITMFAAANSVLINYVMGSRMLYGMARQNLLPAALGKVHATRRTPHVAILTLLVIVIILALIGNISALASATSLLLLMVFCIVNSALIILQRRPGEPRGAFEVPAIIPALGVICCAGLIVARMSKVVTDFENNWLAPAIAGSLVALIGVMYFIYVKLRGRSGETLVIED